MKFRNFIFFTGVGLTLFAQTNLLDNPSFDLWSGTDLTSWQKESGSTVFQESIIVNHGNMSANIIKTGSVNRGIYQDVNVTPGLNCSLTAYIQNSHVSTYIRLTISWFDGGSYLNQYEQSDASSGVGNWQKLQIDETTVPDGANIARCRIRVYGDPDQSCYVDNAQFSLETSLPVSLTSFTAERNHTGYLLEWITESEMNTAGFYIERAVSMEGPYENICPILIQSMGNHSFGVCYQFIDRDCYPAVWYRLVEVTESGDHVILSVLPVQSPAQNIGFVGSRIINISPNPFNPSTVIRYSISAENSGRIEVDIYNLHGKKVKTLVNKNLYSGSYPVFWDGRNSQSQPVPSGLYYCRLSSNHQIMDVQKILKLN